MIAMIAPSTMPIAIDETVSSSVPCRPFSTGPVNIAPRLPGAYCWKMNDHWKRSLVTNRCTNMATSTARTAIVTQRPGCRTGTAVIASVRARPDGVWSLIGVSDLGIHFGRGDRAGLDAPLGGDRLVRAVRDQRLDRLLDRVGEVGLVLGDHVPVRRRVVDI